MSNKKGVRQPFPGGNIRNWMLVASMLDKEIKMKRLNQDKLLLWLKCRFCNEETPCGGCIRLKQGCQEKQAYQQIREMIQKPQVTEEWIKEKIAELNDVWAGKITEEDFIRSIIKEIK